MQWPIFSTVSDWSDAELTRYQIEDLKLKLSPIREIVDSFEPKKKISFFEHLPDFGVFDNEADSADENSQNYLPNFFQEQKDFLNGESLSERIYKEFDQKPTSKTPKSKRNFFRDRFNDAIRQVFV